MGLRTAAVVGWAAAAYARMLGARVRWIDGMRVCSRLPRRAYPRGGITLGDTYLTGADPRSVSTPVIRHEKIHREQWRRHGLTFPIRYVAAGQNPHTNRYEREAGLRDGGYEN